MLTLPGRIMKSRQPVAKARPFFQCAHLDCKESAILRRDIGGKEVKLCKTHDLFHVQLESNEFCEKNGLQTYEQKRDWILAKLASPRPTPAEHWEKVLDTPGLIPIAYEMAREYFKRHPRSIITNPTAFAHPIEDEETEAAFAAYMAEPAKEDSETPQE